MLDDFFGDGSQENEPECSFCGKVDGELIVSISDAYGPTHWHHADCKAEFDAQEAAKAGSTTQAYGDHEATGHWDE